MILTAITLSHAQEVPLNGALMMEIKNTALLPYFNALKDGDVIAIKRYLVPDLYNKNSVLLKQNKKYPEFLATRLVWCKITSAGPRTTWTF